MHFPLTAPAHGASRAGAFLKIKGKTDANNTVDDTVPLLPFEKEIVLLHLHIYP